MSLCLLLVCVVPPMAGGCSVKPQPYTEGQMLSLALADQKAMLEGVPGLAEDASLSLEEAIIRAIAFNLDHRLSLSENSIAESERVLAAVSMLPDISASGNFYNRSNTNASSSMSYQTRQQSLEPSYSSERDRQWGSLEFSWSIVDCGLSYYQAKQQADRVLISLERRRRVINTIVKDVIAAYYRAQAAQTYLKSLRPLIAEAEQALEQYRRIERIQAEPLPEVLDKQRRLVTTIAQLRRIEGDLRQALIQLAALSNFPLRERFVLSSAPMPLPAMKQRIEELELMGLYRRPELREERYQERVDIAAVKQEILKMFPAVRLLASFNLDANPYLVHNHWSEAGLQASASLLELAVAGPQGLRTAEARQSMSQMRRLALSMATIVQINLSRHQYDLALEDLRYADTLKKIEGRLLRQVQNETDLQAGGRLPLVQQKATALSSALSNDMARVDAYTALGNLYFSLGVGLADNLPPEASLDAISTAVYDGLAAMSQGRLPELPAAEAVSDVQAPVVFNDGATVDERREAIERNVKRHE